MSSPSLAVGPLESVVELTYIQMLPSVCVVYVFIQCSACSVDMCKNVYMLCHVNCVLNKMAVFRAQTAKFPVSFRIDPWAAQSTSSL